MKLIHVLGVAIISVLVSTAFGAAPPEKLTLNDLTNHPERWPQTVTLLKGFKAANGMSEKKGQAVEVLEFDGSKVRIDAGNQMVFRVAPDAVDLLDAVNKIWSELTPAQRAVDAETLAADASLWPEKVKLSVS